MQSSIAVGVPLRVVGQARPSEPSVERMPLRRVSMTSPVGALLCSLVFGAFNVVITSTMGGTSEYLRGVGFEIGFGMFGVYFSITMVRVVLEEWNRYQADRHTRSQ